MSLTAQGTVQTPQAAGLNFIQPGLQEVVFIDSNVENYQDLIAGTTSAISQVFVLAAATDGIVQMSELLSKCDSVSAIHIIAHGEAGNLFLGTAQLNVDTFDRYTPLIDGWKERLVPGADILIYGCRVAATDSGTALLHQLRAVTGANIAASSALVGHAALGGGWQLNVTVGTVKTKLGFEPAAMAQFSGTLEAKAFLKVESPSTNNFITSSTYTGGSFQLTNNSTTEKITRIVIDLSSAFLPDIVFDPFGDGGDTTSKGFTINSNPGVGTVTSNYLGAKEGGGFTGLEILFTDFGPGKTFTFSIDIDPTSTKGTASPGPSDAASVSGFELTGSQITVNFNNSSSLSGQLFHAGNVDASQVTLQSNLPVKPSLEILNIASTPTLVSAASQTARVTGPAGAQVSLLVVEAGLFISGGGYDIDPFEANRANSFLTKTATIGSSGFVDIPITLTQSSSESGYNYVIATLKNADGSTGPIAPIKLLQYAPSGSNTAPTTSGITNVSVAQNAPNTVINLFSAFADAQDPDSALTYTVTNNTNPALFDAVTIDPVTGTLTLDYDAVTTGTSQVTVQAKDTGDLTVSTTFTVNVASPSPSPNPTPTPTPTPGAIRINAGGGQYTDSTGKVWAADTYFSSGNSFSTTTAIAGTDADPLYQTERWGKSFSYAIPVTNGTYDINLAFAELYFNAAGQRIFDVTVEGQLISALDNLDLWSKSGQFNAYNSFIDNIAVNDGVLNIGFSASVNNAKISAIEVLPDGASPSPTPTPTPGNTAPTTSGIANVSVAQNAPNTSIDLFAAFADAQDPDSALTYTVTNNTNATLFDAVTIDPVTGKLTLDYDAVATGTSQVTVQAKDTGNLTVSTTFTVNVASPSPTPTPTPTPGAIRINAGGGQYTDSTGKVWAADTYFSSGNSYTTTTAIAGTDADPLYQTERWGKSFSYAIPVTNGTYDINLAFAELYFNAAGQRIFDVTIEGQLISALDNLDLWSKSGQFNAYNSFIDNIAVNDGVLNIGFSASVNNAKISAIEVLPDGASPSPTPTPTPGNTAPTTSGIANVSVAQNAPNTVINLFSAFADAQDPDSALTYTVTNNTNATLFDAVTIDPVTGFLTLDYDAVATGTSQLTVQAKDTGNLTVSTTFTVAVASPSPSPSPTPTDGIIRINTGGGQFTYGNDVWLADQYFSGKSNTNTTTAGIFKTENDTLYQSERWAQNLAYAIPVNNGAYAVNLHFAELYWNDYGQRVFDVSLENELVINDLDIYANSINAFFPGKNSALVQSIPQVTVNDGVLNINLAASVNNASISGIEIIPLTLPLVLFTQSNGSTEVNEATGNDSYSVVLNTQPTANVTIAIQKDGQINTDKTSLTFTPSNWNVAQTVTVTAVNDTAQEGTHFSTITHSISTTDSNYSGLTPASIPVKITDDDSVQISFTKKVVASKTQPTVATWGPDGKLYVGSYGGVITVYTFDDNYNVTGTQNITAIAGLSNKNILGMAFNPFDGKLYVAHSELYANGGAAFPETELSPYSGQVSVLTGPGFSTLQPLITGLPVSNHDHGINDLDFDAQGNLLIAVGGNTNAGIPDPNIGGIPESPFTAAILKANITKSGFNGNVTYTLPPDFVPPSGLTFPPETSQVFGDVADVASGVDVSVYASGLRNPFGLVWTTKGLLYSTDNGANKGFGDVSTSATTQEPFTTNVPDELNLITQGSYYGHPNRNRGRYDNRQNKYYSYTDPSIPGVYTAPLDTAPASTNGITEYRANTFGGQLRGNLLAQDWNGSVYSFTLAGDGKSVTKKESFNTIADGLDLLTGPGGALVGIDLSQNNISVALPDDPSAVGVTAYDIFPWRAPAIGGQSFVIGGKNFGSSANVTIGGVTATINSVSANRIKGVFPALPKTGSLLDVVVNSGGQTSIIEDAFLAV